MCGVGGISGDDIMDAIPSGDMASLLEHTLLMSFIFLVLNVDRPLPFWLLQQGRLSRPACLKYWQNRYTGLIHKRHSSTDLSSTPSFS